MPAIKKDPKDKKLPAYIYSLVTKTELLETPYTQELEDIVSVIKNFVRRYRQRGFYDYFAKDENERREIRRNLGMHTDSIEEWLRAKTRALITYWIESDEIEHTDAMENILDRVEDIWYDKKK